ncbi:hypothetical protein JW899_00285 [Candidatus Uhrbacteria bacterium]|nr:hypothetical protein [Candidatus Uhrbacteria bacterium]
MSQAKVIKTVRGTIKKGIYYLGARIPYELTQRLISPLSQPIGEIVKEYPVVGELYDDDLKIRETDDLLDEVLAKRNPFPAEEMKRVIAGFAASSSKFRDVVRLFSLELDLRGQERDTPELRAQIKELIDLRPCDYFLLADDLIARQGSALDRSDLERSVRFFREFQRLRDLLDDMMSIEEDALKNSYNSIVTAKTCGVPWDFFDGIVQGKLAEMKGLVGLIRRHPYLDLLEKTVDFWMAEYELLFKPLLTGYYADPKEFEKNYFMFKQT